MSHFTVAASTSAASLGARAAAAAKRRPGSLRAKGSGGSMTRGVSLRVRAMNADEAPKKMNPEQRARAARQAKMEAEAELAEAEAEQKAEAEAKAKAAEVGIEARARASLRQKLEAELAELAAMDALEEEKLAAAELAAAEPVVPVVPVAAAATATPNAAVAKPAMEEESAESSEYKSSLFTDGAFEDALKGVNDMAEDIGVDVSDAPIDAPTIDWGGIDSVRSLTEDDPFPGFDGGVPNADDFSPASLEPAMAATVSSTPSPAVEAAMASSAADGFVPAAANSGVPALAAAAPPPERQQEQVRSFLYPGEEELPDDVNMTIWEHLEELRDRALVSAGACGVAVLLCFCFAKDLVIFLEQPVIDQVKFLQLGPGEYFFTTVKVAGYCGLLLGAPVVLYEAIAYVVPGLTRDERKVLGPIVLGSSVLFYAGIFFAYSILTPAALKFFIGYSSEAVESLWSIDQYFEFVLVLLFSTGLSFQVPVIQLLLGQSGIVSSKQMLSIWKYVVVGSVVAAAVLTPSTDPFTQMLLAVPLMSLYLGGAALVGVVEKGQGGGDVNQIEG